ncbi:MAG: hypothetical protein JRM73_00185 [Nitrososphaerota archaeon]|nr:hypothetical protein [Nitrososphaerota archaeon]
MLLDVHRAKGFFAGGELGKVANYFLAGMAVSCFAFGARVVLDVVGINPEFYLISLRDLGAGVVLVLVLLGLRSGAKVWTSTRRD